jgi:hypothetical protein
MVSFTPKVDRLRTHQREPTIELSVADLEPVSDGPAAIIHPPRSGRREPTMEIDISDRDVMVMGNTLVYCLLAPSPPPVPKRASRRLAPPPAFFGRNQTGKDRLKVVENRFLKGALPVKELDVKRTALPRWTHA